MRHFGVMVKGGRNNVDIGVKALPKIKFANVEVTPNDDVRFHFLIRVDYKFQGRFDPRPNPKYLSVTDKLERWVVAYPRRVDAKKIQ